MRALIMRIAGIAIAAASACAATSVAAQPGPGGRGAGMMMGPGMMGPGMMWGSGMCSPRGAGMAEWRLSRIEQRVRPTEAQRAKLNELRDVSVKAAAIIAAACPSEISSSPVTRLETMEKRLNAMLQALKLVQPAFKDFYNLLTSEQQRQLDAAAPRGWGWRGWRWEQRETR